MGLLKSIIIMFACAVYAAAELHPLSDAYIDHINSKQTTWRAGRNFPHNTPLKHLKNLLGALPEKEVSLLPRLTYDAEVIANLPESFDARENWPNCPSIREIRDQGSCGSCWAVAAVETMTDRVCTYSNGTRQFHFSADDLISCCSDCGSGCQGGFSSMAWLYWIKYGIVSGGNYNSSLGCRPYSTPPCLHHAPWKTVNSTKNLIPCLNETRETPECLSTCGKNYGVAYENDKLFGKNVTVIFDGEDQIKAELFMNGPVQAIFVVYLDFYSYKSGVYFPVFDDPDDFLGGHSVKIIGWGVQDGIKYWLVANSWNSAWGDNGFFKVGRGSNVCGIEAMVLAGEPLFTGLEI